MQEMHVRAYSADQAACQIKMIVLDHDDRLRLVLDDGGYLIGEELVDIAVSRFPGDAVRRSDRRLFDRVEEVVLEKPKNLVADLIVIEIERTGFYVDQ